MTDPDLSKTVPEKLPVACAHPVGAHASASVTRKNAHKSFFMYSPQTASPLSANAGLLRGRRRFAKSQTVKLRECRPTSPESASLRPVETLHNSRRISNRLNYFLGVFHEPRNREGTPSSRSNSRSSKDAAIPYQFGVAAGSARCTWAIVIMTTFPRPTGRLTSTISSSIGGPASHGLGQGAYPPVWPVSPLPDARRDFSPITLHLPPPTR